MRIAFVSCETVHHRETETNARLQSVAELLRDDDHDVHVLCARWWEGGSKTHEHDGITYHAVSDGPEARRSFLLRLPFVVTSIRPDVVHAVAERPGEAPAAGLVCPLIRAPLLVEWCGGEDVRDGHLDRWAVGRADRVVTPSRLVRTWVRELGVDDDRIDVVPNPIDLELIRDTSPDDGADVVYARRLDEAANLESLFLALAELRDHEWTATVIGDGPERDTYERLATDLAIDDSVTFVGAASRAERIAIYRDSHAFVQTAEYCVFPTELAWALAAGCVGVVEYHADSSAHELVEGRDRGFRVTNQEELVDAILEAETLEGSDYDDAYEEFSRQRVLDRYLEQYRGLVDPADST